jgi:hypothetical protein
MENSKFIVPDPVSEMSLVVRGRSALKRLRKTIAALDPKQLRPLNIDIPLAVSRALGVLPAVLVLRERATTECPGLDLTAIEQLEDRALATATVNGEFEMSISTPPGFQTLVDEAFESRAGLLTVLRMLAALNYIKPESIDTLNGGHGYRDVAEDLIAIVSLLTRNWPAIEGKVPLTQANLDRFQALAENVLEMVGVREQAPVRADEAKDLRARAFTLLDEAYDEVRRMVTFLRWREGDADDIAPPLRVRLPVRRIADKPGTEPASTAPASPASPAKPEAPTKPEATVIAPPVPTGPAPSGLPRSNPFTT